ncbi:response regulator transcription factor [Desmospora profundinema]|nr:response regulator transcription factor [Desmospora profundinema]
MRRNVLVADDDRDIVRLIRDALEYEGFHVRAAHDGRSTYEIVKQETVDFIILDIMMPEMDGLETCRLIRKNHGVPILILSARDRELDKIVGLEIGADDYMTKPFSVQELAARVKAHFRRIERLRHEWGEGKPDSPLQLDERTYEVFVDGSPIDLSTREFQILHHLASRPNQVVSREQLYASVWGDTWGDRNTVTVHIKNLRKKLGRDFIKTVWGVGYKFVGREPGP